MPHILRQPTFITPIWRETPHYSKIPGRSHTKLCPPAASNARVKIRPPTLRFRDEKKPPPASNLPCAAKGQIAARTACIQRAAPANVYTPGICRGAQPLFIHTPCTCARREGSRCARVIRENWLRRGFLRRPLKGQSVDFTRAASAAAAPHDFSWRA